MEQIKVTIEKTTIDTSEINALMDAVRKAKECADKAKAEIVPRLLVEGRAKYDAIVEQCDQLGKIGVELCKLRNLFNDQKMVIRANCKYGGFEIACRQSGYCIMWGEYVPTVIEFTDDLAQDTRSWLVNWNEWKIMDKLIDDLKYCQNAVKDYYLQDVEHLQATETKMLS